MGTKRNLSLYKIISEEAINKISNVSFDILENIGMKIPNERVWKGLIEFGAEVNKDSSIVKIPSNVISKAIELAGEKH